MILYILFIGLAADMISVTRAEQALAEAHCSSRQEANSYANLSSIRSKCCLLLLYGKEYSIHVEKAGHSRDASGKEVSFEPFELSSRCLVDA
jgi:hypothetical protein